jgi:hypothetical protein
MNVSPFAQKKRAAPAKAGFTPQGYTLFAVRYSVTGSRHPFRQKKYSGGTQPDLRVCATRCIFIIPVSLSVCKGDFPQKAGAKRRGNLPGMRADLQVLHTSCKGG